MKNARPIIVAYDISDNKARSRLHKILKAWRIGGQKSVHECRLNVHQAEELFLQLSEPMEKEKDRLLMAWLNRIVPSSPGDWGKSGFGKMCGM